jgi:Tol biopolymer transport system component
MRRIPAQEGFSVVVDGKPSAKFVNLIGNALAFSADGKHSAYAGCTNYGKCQLVADGVATNLPSVGNFASRTRPQVIPQPVFYSPDGSQMVYIYPKSDGTSLSAVVLNGKEVARGTSIEFPTFSPDGKHFAMIAWTGKGYTVLADGKVGPTYEDIFEANPNVVRFLDAHTLRLLAVKGGSVYRVTIDLQ